jgi:hypothetical protein
MRRSELERAVADEFGPAGASLVHDLALGALDGRTATVALAEGVATRDIWIALCDEMGVPPERRYGAGRLEPRRT